MISFKRMSVGVALATICVVASAADDTVARVNGVAISKLTVDQIVKQKVASGAPDSPELRQAIKDELINRELLAQEAKKLKLDQSQEVQEQKKFLEQNLMIDLFLGDYFSKNPIPDAEVKKEYDRQSQEVKNNNLQEYKLRHISLAKEDEAKLVIARLKKGEVFGKLAKEKSIDANKNNEGDLGWIVSQQLQPQIKSVLANLDKGGYTKEPLKTSTGWEIIKLEDKRDFVLPSFDSVKNQIKSSLIQKKKNEMTANLKSQAKIE